MHGSLDRAVLAVDRSLRRAKGIFEFCEAEECILRIAIIASEAHILLPDGTEIHPQDPIIDLHFWNEHLLRLGEVRSSLAWGGAFRARLRTSMRLLAEYLDENPDLAEVKACRARTAFLRDRSVRRIAYRLGFVEALPEESLSDHVHEFLETFLIYGLTWVFNPQALPEKACLPQRLSLWISREELFRRYGSCSGSEGPALPEVETCDEAPAGD